MRYLILTVLLTGCYVEPVSQEEVERRKLTNYRCDEKQLELVQKEIALCKEGNFDADCFRWAKISQCTYVTHKSTEQKP